MKLASTIPMQEGAYAERDISTDKRNVDLNVLTHNFSACY